MTMSTQRLIILIIVINFVFGFITDIHQNTNYQMGDVDQIVEITYNQTDYAMTHETETQTDGSLADTSTWGSGLGMSTRLVGIFFKGLLPAPFLYQRFSTTIEQLISSAIILLSALFNIVVVIEIYMFFKNKKVT